jgi:hypothetical protein
MVQLHPRSLANAWSVSVSAARVRGRDEGRVQFPDGPLKNIWGVGPTGRRLACTQEIGVRLPDAPLKGSWSNGTTLARQARDPGSIPGESTVREGSRIRLAGTVC